MKRLLYEFTESFRIAFAQIRANKMRSMLTALGVIIGIVAVPRMGYRLGVPEGFGAWREALNSDASVYGGSNLGNGGGTLAVQGLGAHGRGQSIVLTLPPLATVFLVAV